LVCRILNDPEYYPISFWEGQQYYVEMMVEKVDLVGLFRPVARKYYVPITNVKGWGDINCRAAMMERLMRHENAGRKVVLLYCGDHDPGGFHISNHLKSNMEDLAEAVGWSPENIIVDRFGVSAEFIEQQGIPWINNLITASGGDLSIATSREGKKAYVRNYIAKHGVRKVEANALVTRIDAGRELCRVAIEKYISIKDADAHQEAIDEQAEEVKACLPEAMREMID
jgi:hypothetical protein